MTLLKKPLRLLCPLAILCAATSATAQSNTVFNYGPSSDYVTANTQFDRVASVTMENPTAQIAAFSATDPLLRSSATSYTGPTIYGGYQFSSSSTASSFPRQQIRNYAKSPDSITLQNYSQDGWGGSKLSLHGIFLFKQQDYNEGFKTGAIAPSGFSASWSTYFKGDSRNVEGRYVVQIEDQLYVASQSFGMTNSGSNYLTATSMTSVKWAKYQPAADLNFSEDDASYLPLDLTNVSAVGIYFEEDQWIGDDSVAAPYAFSITSFKVTGAAQ